MEINYVSFLHPFHFNGGGEMVLRALIEWGEKNHDIKVNYITAKPQFDEFNEQADLTLFADVFNCPDSLKRFSKKDISNLITKSKKIIHFNNAYTDLCGLDYIPCSGNSSEVCHYKKELSLVQKLKRCDFSSGCDGISNITRDLYLKADLNIFVSPLHRLMSEKVLGQKTKSFILRPLIKTENFKNKNIERDIENLFVGVVSEAKGVGALRERFADSSEEITIIGNNSSDDNLDFANYLGFVPYEEIPNYFSRAKNFVFLPRWPEPQGRVVIEAALSGCNLITNENVGATSFDFDISNPDNIKDVEKEFWEQVYSIV